MLMSCSLVGFVTVQISMRVSDSVRDGYISQVSNIPLCVLELFTPANWLDYSVLIAFNLLYARKRDQQHFYASNLYLGIHVSVC